jgi:DNA-binding XRE family transcriptional regulator
VANESTEVSRDEFVESGPCIGDVSFRDDSPFWGISQQLNISAGVNPRDREYQEACKAFRYRLVRARKEAGMTQREVCAKMGKSTSFISKCELGERRVDYVELQKLAKIYRKSMSFFNLPSKIEHSLGR